jgi:hypothetical protein
MPRGDTVARRRTLIAWHRQVFAAHEIAAARGRKEVKRWKVERLSAMLLVICCNTVTQPEDILHRSLTRAAEPLVVDPEHFHWIVTTTYLLDRLTCRINASLPTVRPRPR